MRTFTKIHKRAMTIKTNRFSLGNPLYDFCFELFPFEQLKCFVSRTFLTDKWDIVTYNLLHPFFYCYQIIGSEGTTYIEIVIETILCRGSDSKNCIREKITYNVGHYVGGRVANTVPKLRQFQVLQFFECHFKYYLPASDKINLAGANKGYHRKHKNPRSLDRGN